MRVRVFILLVCFLTLCPFELYAKPDTYTRDTPFTKLGRGIFNLATFPLELVVQPVRVGKVDGKVAAALPAGLFQGTYFMVGRLFSSLYDVVTFPIPRPREYAPLFYPPTVFDGARSAEERVWPYPPYGFGRQPLGVPTKTRAKIEL